MKRYKELKFEGKVYNEQYKIDEILIDKGFSWFLDCEVENVRIEILYETLIFNAGVFFNGAWIYGVFRDGEWKNGVWENGVWYNGTWRRGIFKSGLIFDGRFFNGEILEGSIKGGEFIDIKISPEVIREDQYDQKKDKNVERAYPEKLSEKHIKLYEEFIDNEDFDGGFVWEEPKKPSDYYFYVLTERNFFDDCDLITMVIAEKESFDNGKWVKLTNRNIPPHILKTLRKAYVDTSDVGDNLFDFFECKVKTKKQAIKLLTNLGFVYNEDIGKKYKSN
jgi:hypothetical protein